MSISSLTWNSFVIVIEIWNIYHVWFQCYILWFLCAKMMLFQYHFFCVGSDKIQAEKVSEVHQSEAHMRSENKELGKGIKYFPATLWVIQTVNEFCSNICISFRTQS